MSDFNQQRQSVDTQYNAAHDVVIINSNDPREVRELKEQFKTFVAEMEMLKTQLRELTNQRPTPELETEVANLYETVVPSNEDDKDRILRDPSLSVREKIDCLGILINDRIDNEVEQEMQLVNSVQHSPSVDVETAKLMRMIDARNRKFDKLRRLVNESNRTAKRIIDSIGR